MVMDLQAVCGQQGGAYQFTVVRVKGVGLVAPVVEQTGEAW